MIISCNKIHGLTRGYSYVYNKEPVTFGIINNYGYVEATIATQNFVAMTTPLKPHHCASLREIRILVH